MLITDDTMLCGIGTLAIHLPLEFLIVCWKGAIFEIMMGRVQKIIRIFFFLPPGSKADKAITTVDN
jgi:hypothetical protein